MFGFNKQILEEPHAIARYVKISFSYIGVMPLVVCTMRTYILVLIFLFRNHYLDELGSCVSSPHKLIAAWLSQDHVDISVRVLI